MKEEIEEKNKAILELGQYYQYCLENHFNNSESNNKKNGKNKNRRKKNKLLIIIIIILTIKNKMINVKQYIFNNNMINC